MVCLNLCLAFWLFDTIRCIAVLTLLYFARHVFAEFIKAGAQLWGSFICDNEHIRGLLPIYGVYFTVQSALHYTVMSLACFVSCPVLLHVHTTNCQEALSDVE